MTWCSCFFLFGFPCLLSSAFLFEIVPSRSLAFISFSFWWFLRCYRLFLSLFVCVSSASLPGGLAVGLIDYTLGWSRCEKVVWGMVYYTGINDWLADVYWLIVRVLICWLHWMKHASDWWLLVVDSLMFKLMLDNWSEWLIDLWIHWLFLRSLDVCSFCLL